MFLICFLGQVLIDLEDMYIIAISLYLSSLCCCIAWFLRWADSLDLLLHAALLPGYNLDWRPYSGLVALVFTVVMGVLACFSECLHVLPHRVVV